MELKHQPPPEAAKPDKKWRLYVFKGDEAVDDPLPLHRCARRGSTEGLCCTVLCLPHCYAGMLCPPHCCPLCLLLLQRGPRFVWP